VVREPSLLDTAALRRKMGTIAAQMRELISAMPPEDLLGYISSVRTMNALNFGDAEPGDIEHTSPSDPTTEFQFLLEYVHAVLATELPMNTAVFDESACTKLFEHTSELMQTAMLYAMASTPRTEDGVFGSQTSQVEFHAKSNWVLLRGNRYQVLEGEFYRYVLQPHNAMLRQVYGVGAEEIAAGFQQMSDASRSGPADAISEIERQFASATAFAKERKRPLDQVMGDWLKSDPDGPRAAGLAFDDMLRGGTGNLSRHTSLPDALLADLAFERGEDTEFFAPGDYAGTPFRTLPARKKPLIKLDAGYYAIDPCLFRDAGYRSLLFNLLERSPDYRGEFKERQKLMSEAAYADILQEQLAGSTVYREVFYKDPTTRQWCENDVLILLDDVLYLVEAKAGAAATIASPAGDFDRHAQSVTDLVVKAYRQCRRFFEYLNSADEVALFARRNGKYEECGRIRREDYRVLIPIGLTVESFSPFSTFCKELPEIQPLLGAHPFISMSIDDLFVLRRFLPAPGEFAHYMTARQAVAGLRGVHLFDELDHLGAYIRYNRFDQTIVDQVEAEKADWLVWDGMSDVVDGAFEGEDWESEPIPSQPYPDELLALLSAINRTRSSGWLSIDNHVRDFGAEARSNLARMISQVKSSLISQPSRYFMMHGDGPPLFMWVQRALTKLDSARFKEKAAAAGLVAGSPEVVGIVAYVDRAGTYTRVERVPVQVPSGKTPTNASVYEEADRMRQPHRHQDLRALEPASPKPKKPKVGRNDPCPCGSGLKFKKCHGRR
jgi:hypothetical protein